jgi:Protein of unknown function (DUF642)/PEP-CTERM motif
VYSFVWALGDTDRVRLVGSREGLEVSRWVVNKLQGHGGPFSLKRLSSLFVLSALSFVSSAAAATIFTDGFTATDKFDISAGLAAGNFTVASGNVDLISGADPTYGFLCGGASACLDLNGLNQGSVTSTLSTVVGTTYTLTFTLGSAQRGTTASATVSVDSAAPQTFTDPVSGVKTITFVATSTATALTFASNTPGANGDVLSGVTVVSGASTVPEPSTMLLMSLPLLAFGSRAFRRVRA